MPVREKVMLITVPLSLVPLVKQNPHLQFAQETPLGIVEGTCLVKLTVLSRVDYSRTMHYLREHCIPATVASNKETGDIHHIRIDSNGHIWNHTTQHEELHVPFTKLIELSESPGQLDAFVAAHKAAIKDPSWENQEHYRNVYLTTQLIKGH